VDTSHILFVAAGAFNVSKPSDLIPELQGRFPLRVELESLGKEEFLRILTEPKNALTKQYVDLLGTEGVDIEFTPESIDRLAALAAEVNSRLENIGARRLHTIMETLLEELSFDAPDVAPTRISITEAYVNERLQDLAVDNDLGRYIL
jgi:ATP-dependent HslUV protease ATP-binding subunit HslU